MIYNVKLLKKKFIELKNIRIDLEQLGIILIKGSNGCGKTTLLENIIFSTEMSDYIFNSAQEEKMFVKERYNLFSYVPQNVVYCEMNVSNYIIKMNKKVCSGIVNL